MLEKKYKNLRGGLQDVADQLQLHRTGPQHQAGSDALLTGMVFFKMLELHPDYKNFKIEPTSIFQDNVMELRNNSAFFNLAFEDFLHSIKYCF